MRTVSQTLSVPDAQLCRDLITISIWVEGVLGPQRTAGRASLAPPTPQMRPCP